MSRYSCKVDWISLGIPYYAMGEGSEQGTVGEAASRAISNEVEQGLASDLLSDVHALDYGRSPYEYGWRDETSKCFIWAGGTLPHFALDLTAVSLDYLRQVRGTEPATELPASRFTRLDIAIDIETDVQPEAFIAERSSGRQKSGGTFHSGSGTTCYIGSRHSERFMRVYRYAHPHPRAHLLRLEVVFRRAYAKQAGSELLTHGLESVAKAALEAFGFIDLVAMEEEVHTADLSVYRPERNGGKTLRWMITQVAPAFKKLCAEGVIPSPTAFLEEYFLDTLTDDEAT